MKRPVQAVISGIALSAIMAFAGHAADLVVLESNVPGFAPGSVVAESSQVKLDGGARLVMIASDGSTKSVNGPYSGPIGRATANAPGVLQRLTEGQDDSSHVIGAIRAPSWDKSTE